MASINHMLDVETATLIAAEFGYNVESVSFDVESAIEVGHEAASDEALKPRPAGRDHHGPCRSRQDLPPGRGPTDERDQPRSGGITQHIGAYTVEVNGKTGHVPRYPGPRSVHGHAGAGARKVTDIVVLVVAADDGVMPQTVEAINHAKAANVPIVVRSTRSTNPMQIRIG